MQNKRNNYDDIKYIIGKEFRIPEELKIKEKIKNIDYTYLNSYKINDNFAYVELTSFNTYDLDKLSINEIINNENCYEIKINIEKFLELCFETLDNIRFERKNLINKRKIKKLTHYTDINNLDSILKNGIYSKDYSTIYLDAYINDEDTLNLDNYISLNVSIPNYKKLNENKDNIYAIFDIDSKILIDKLDSMFILNNDNNRTKQELFYLKKYLTNNYFLEKFYNDKNRNQLTPISNPTCLDSYVLINEFIDKKYINNISLYNINKNEYKKVKEIVLNHNINIK